MAEPQPTQTPRESPDTEREAAFIPITQVELESNRALFVRPPGIPEDSEDDRKRIFLIVGEKESGKETAAINFALSIVEREKARSGPDVGRGAVEPLPVKMYQHRGGSMALDINIYLTNPISPGVFVIPDIDNYIWHSDALSERNVNFYETQLRKHRHTAYFILTAHSQAVSRIGISPFITEGVSLEAVLEKHEIHYLRSKDLPDQPILTALHDPKILHDLNDRNRLGTPKRIGILFQNLLTISPKEGEEAAALQRIIRNIAISQTPEVRRWFRELPMNVKLFAMTMAILTDNNYRLTRFAAEELYFAFVQKVRQKPGMDGESAFIDPRRVGFDDVVASANMFMQGSILTFNSQRLLQNLLDHEIANYQGLLWVLSEMLVDQIAPPPQSAVRNPAVYDYIGNPDAPTLVFENAQEVLANLVGTVGIFRRERLRDLLERVGRQEGYKELAGQILSPLAKKAQQHDFLLSILDSWLHPKDERGKATEAYHPQTVLTALYTLATNYAIAISASGVTVRTRQELRDMVAHTATIVGGFEAFIKDYETRLEAALEQEIRDIHEAKGDKALTEGDLKTKRDKLALEVALETLRQTEMVILFLLLMLDEIAEDYPEDVVGIINEWLENGLKQIEKDDYELEDDADIERMLRIEDASSLRDEQTRAARKRQKRRQRIVLNNMQWHIAMMSALMFFESDVIMEETEPDAEDEERNAETGEPLVASEQTAEGDIPQPETPETSAVPKSTATSDTPALNMDENAANTPVTSEVAEPGVQPENEPFSTHMQDEFVQSRGVSTAHKDDPAAVIEPETAPVAPDEQPAATKSREKSNVQPRKKNDNRITIVQKRFPFLNLLPNLLKSGDVTFTTTSFLENITRGADVRRYYRAKKISHTDYFLFDFLQGDPLRAAFRMLHKWYGVMVDDPKNPDEEGRKEWSGAVFPALLKLFNHATQGQRPRLREILFTEGWVDSRYPEIRTIAHALLARAFILDGRVLDLPANRYGVVLLDWGIRDYQWDRYYQAAYRLIQQLAAITPLRIYPLGSQNLIKEIAGRDGDFQIMPRELRPRRTSPRLLMPLFESEHQEAVLYDARHTHFVLALTPLVHLFFDPEDPASKPDILDLLDVVEWVTEGVPDVDPKIQKILGSNLYTEKEKEAARQKLAAVPQTTDWDWQQKVFLLTPDKESVVTALNAISGGGLLPGAGRSTGIEDLFTLLDVQDATFHDDIDRIVSALSVRLGQNLHELTDDEWEQDLRNVWQNGEDRLSLEDALDFDDRLAIRDTLNRWIGNLEDVTKARHPRDITMTIIWTVLALSKRNLPQTIALVKEWLEAAEPQANIMGLACTKTLYNFYYLSPDIYERREHYQPLLELLPAVMEMGQGQDSSEFSQLLSIVMMLARDATWSQLFTTGDTLPLAEAVRKIRDRRGVADLRWLVSLQQIFVRLAQLVVASGKNWSDFRDFLRQVADWYTRTKPNQRARQLPNLEARLQTESTPSKLVQHAVSLLDDIGAGVGTAYTNPDGIRLFTAFATGQVYALGRYTEAELNEVALRVRHVANFILLHSTRRLDTRMPALADGQRYGVILIRGTDRQQASDLRSHVIGFVKDMRIRLRDTDYNHIVFTIHNIGRTDLVYNNSATPPTQADLRLPDNTPEPALLMSPILESYRLEDVAFVLIISDIHPLDLADWRDEDEWVDKIYLFGRGRSFWMDTFYERDEQRKQRIKADIKEVADMIMEVIKG